VYLVFSLYWYSLPEIKLETVSHKKTGITVIAIYSKVVIAHH